MEPKELTSLSGAVSLGLPTLDTQSARGTYSNQDVRFQPEAPNSITMKACTSADSFNFKPQSAFLDKESIKGQLFEALIDTGAHISLVSTTCVQQILKQKITPHGTLFQRCVTANNAVMELVTKIMFKFDIEGIMFPLSAYVATSLSSPIIIGLDFLEDERIQAELFIHDRVIKIGNYSFNLHDPKVTPTTTSICAMDNLYDSSQAEVKLDSITCKDTYTIPKFSEAMILGV